MEKTNKTENKIRAAFEFQRFAPNARIAAMIAKTERRYAPLEDDDLLMVAAAGEAQSRENPLSKKENESKKNTP